MSTAIDQAVAWLRHQLADGAKSANLIRTEAEAALHSGASLRRAKDQLGIKSERQSGSGGAGQWLWSLPDQPQDAQTAGSVQDAQAQGAQAPTAEPQGNHAQGVHIITGVPQDAQALADWHKMLTSKMLKPRKVLKTFRRSAIASSP